MTLLFTLFSNLVWERLFDVKFNKNAQTWVLNHYWLLLLGYFFSSLSPKGCAGRTPMGTSSYATYIQSHDQGTIGIAMSMLCVCTYVKKED